MTRFTRTESGRYMVSGHSYEMLIGTRAQVWHGTAYKTSGGLCKSDLLQNKAGRIVSKSKHSTAKRERRLVKAGYGTKKGKFGYVKLSKKGRKMNGGTHEYGHHMSKHHSHHMHHMYKKGGKSRSRRHRQRGGMMHQLMPSYYDGKGVGTSGVNLQFVAGNASS